MKKLTNLFAIMMFIAISLNAQNPKEKIELTLTLRDGNIITGTCNSINNVLLVTDYGKLDIPVKNVSEMTFGVIADKDNEGKINNLLKQMSVNNEDQKKAAYDELVKFGLGAIPIINDYIYSNIKNAVEITTPTNAAGEVSEYTPENALSDIKSEYKLKDEYPGKDVINIDGEYKIGGIYTLKNIVLKNEFGQQDVPKNKIEKVSVSYEDLSGDNVSFKLMASQHISGNTNGGWLSTNIVLKKGQKFTITATGEVVLASLSNGKYNPNGAVTTTTYDYEDSYPTATSYPSYGNVVYRIGDTGEAKKAGAKFTGTANMSGTLYISIYETVYNAANTGSYKVKVRINN